MAAEAGLEPRSLDPGRVRWVVEDRCRRLQLRAVAYAEHLQSSPSEFDSLIDALTIQETRFFRDPAVFEAIALWVPRAVARFAEPLRILSAPCSTGQEAYSLAGLLHHAGLPVSQFSIDALDISASALATAQRGVYADTGLDKMPPELQAACGVLDNNQCRVHDALRERIRFERRNLAAPGALGNEPRYHLILCRNLFIYLHAEARATLAQSLADVLIPGGRLILGAADHVPELEAHFSPLHPKASFACTHIRRTAAQSGGRRKADQSLGIVAKAQRSHAAQRRPRTSPEASDRTISNASREQSHQRRRALSACRGAPSARQSAPGRASLPAGALPCTRVSARARTASGTLAISPQLAAAARPACSYPTNPYEHRNHHSIFFAAPKK